MRGRKPKPTSLKQLEGNPGKRPLNRHEPQPKRVIPKCPAHLDAEAKHEWRRVAKQLYDMGVLSTVDRPALAAYCVAWSRWVYAEEQLKKYGPVFVTKDKRYPIQSPYIALANQAIKQMQWFESEFGMTPSSRTRIHAVPPRDSRGGLKAFAASKSRFFPR